MTKIAFPTDDGVTICPHFGRAQFYVVVTLNEPDAPQYERREKVAHGSHEAHEHEHEHDAEHHQRHDHNPMFAPLSDCQVLVAGGMGQPAYEHAQGMGLQVLLTGEREIAAALEAYRNNTLNIDMRRVHVHR